MAFLYEDGRAPWQWGLVMEGTPKCDLCGAEAVFYSVFDDFVCEGCLDKHPDKGDTVFGLINDPEDE